MNVASLLNQKKLDRDSKREAAEKEARLAANRHRNELNEAIAKVSEALEGLDFEHLHDGQFRINYRDFHREIPVYVEVRWHKDTGRYCDECPPVEEWNLKVGIGCRAINVPEFYCGVSQFAESLSDFLLRI